MVKLGSTYVGSDRDVVGEVRLCGFVDFLDLHGFRFVDRF